MNLDGFAEYLRIKRGLGEKTVDGYVSDINQFLKFSEGSLDSYTINHYIEQSLKTKKACTINRFISAMVNLREWLELIGKKYEFRTPERLRTAKRLPKFISYDKLKTIFNLPVKTEIDYRNMFIFLFIYSTGIRVSEAVNIKLSDIHTDKGFVSVSGKGNKQRAVPIATRVKPLLEEYIKIHRVAILKNNGSDYLFVGKKGKLTRQMIWRIIKDIGLKLGIENSHPHLLRHSYATALTTGGADLRIVEALLGHKNLETTTIYTHIPSTFLVDEFKRCHPREK